MKRISDKSLTTGRVSKSRKFRDGKNHAIRTTKFFQNSTNDKR